MSNADLNPQVLARIREAADIVEVVGEHVRLTRRGRRWTGLCPFHDEKTPSFSVDPERGLYYCFGCHAGGDTIRFVMEIEHLDFVEAVETLARRFNVALPPKTPDARRRSRQAEQIRALLGEAQAFFEAQLAGEAGRAARDELVRRGFAPGTWHEFGFGFAPDSWDALLNHLSGRHTEGAIIDAGLARAGNTGKRPYDRFRNRITFPIHGGDGNLIAFGGRILGDGEPKYLNSPETVLFHKRSTLFMLPRARRPIGEAGFAVVVEGYFDCLSLHRAGITQAVATLGTALTPDHARILRRLAHRVLLCYDADQAGRRATAAGAEALLAAGLDVAVIVLPAGKDPDDIVREGGAAAFAALLEQPVSLLDFLMRDLPQNQNERRRAGVALASLVGAARDPVARFALLEELARRLDLPVDVLRESAQRRGPARSGRRSPSAPVRAPALPPGERELIRILLECKEEWRRKILDLVDGELLRSGITRKIFELFRSRDRSPGTDPVTQLVNSSEDPTLIQLMAQLSLGGQPPLSEEGIRSQVKIVLRRQAELQSRRLQPLIEAAAARGDLGELARLQEEKRQILLKIPDL